MRTGVDPATGLVRDELPCRKCGYNLRGLHVEGRCPECGTPVGVSVMGELLRYSDPNWVRTLARGVKTIIAGIVVIVLGVIVSMVVGAMRGPLELAQAIILIGNILMVVGAWLLTEPDPSGVGEDKYGTSRKIIRIALIAGVINTLLNLMAEAIVLPPPVRIAVVVVGVLAGIVGLVGQFAQLNYLSKLAARIPDRALEKRARFLMWAIGISYGALLVLGGVVAIIFAVSGPPTAATGGAGLIVGFGCFAGIAGLALIVFGIMYILMLDKFRMRLNEQASLAESTWARATSIPPPPLQST